MSETTGLTIRVEPAAHPLVTRAAAILRERLAERGALTPTPAAAGPEIVLALAPDLPAEGYRLEPAARGVRIAGGTPRGVLYGVGQFLRTSRYDGGFQPSAWRGVSVPHCPVRGMYFATHFHNWYHVASPAETVRYLEDLALWGANAIMVIFPMINLRGWDDPQAEPALAMVRQYARAVKDLGLLFVTAVNNTMFSGAPAAIRATPLTDPLHRRGNSGHPVCPSRPDGHAYLMANARELFARLADVGVDLLCHWPYDEGGCACPQCAPWGCNGYYKLSREFSQVAREYFPHLQTILSTWTFDTPPEGEWQGLADNLARGNDWLDYLLADAHEDFPRYPLDVGRPGGLPLLNFPEISMWGNWPWGGVGAHPLPARCQRLWDQVRHLAQGGFPYSEGIYEDLNKAVVLQFYWDRARAATATLAAYSNYEFGAATTPDVLTLIAGLEDAASRACRREPVAAADAVRRAELADDVHRRLPAWAQRNWRWELLLLRARLDRERFARGGLTTPAADAALERLMDLYHCQRVTDDPYHHRVRPRARSAVSRGGQC